MNRSRAILLVFLLMLMSAKLFQFRVHGLNLPIGEILRCRSQIVALCAQITVFFLRCNLHREAGTLVDERLDYIVTSAPRHISACLTVLDLIPGHKFPTIGGS
jgi:hypothetical protein